MLLFIITGWNTNARESSVSIHLMLLFIGGGLGQYGDVLMFQYISCYSLSILPLLLETVEISFNTSHVTLYQRTSYSGFIKAWKFQYISCYSLSENYGKMFRKNICFNTSHVTLYHKERQKLSVQKFLFQYISCYSLSNFTVFQF